MRISPQALERLKGAPLSGRGLAEILEQILASNPAPELVPLMSLTLDYQVQGDAVEAGDLIPLVSIALRPATILAEAKDAGSTVDIPSGTTEDE